MIDVAPGAPARDAPRHEVDKQKLHVWMQEHIAGFSGVIEVQQFRRRAVEPHLPGANRRKPRAAQAAGQALPSAHAVEREFRVLETTTKRGLRPVSLPATSVEMSRVACH